MRIKKFLKIEHLSSKDAEKILKNANVLNIYCYLVVLFLYTLQKIQSRSSLLKAKGQGVSFYQMMKIYS